MDDQQVDCEQDALMTVVEDRDDVAERILQVINTALDTFYGEADDLESVIQRMTDGEFQDLIFETKGE